MAKQYVCHISGQGEKWEVTGRLYNQEQNEDWQVASKTSKDEFSYHYLPKSEYRLCPAPEVWKDVTEDVKEGDPSEYWQYFLMDDLQMLAVNAGHGYRLRKVPLFGSVTQDRPVVSKCAFIVEKKVQP